MKIINYCNKVIEYSFYLLFFLVPLALTGDTSELFEFNKLWVTFIITIIIGAAWFTKMAIKKEIRIQRTPLDIPIVLFLVSEIISSFISLDTHVSFWGYYSRFNGGLFSIISYIFLYYAFVSNLLVEEVKEKVESKVYDFKKGALFFLGGIGVFLLGFLISSALKPATEAGVPYQMLALLIGAIASLIVFMKAAPSGAVQKSLFAIFSSAFVVIIWGLPSHFGYDPTCLLFRGTFDVACWTNDFQPKVRIFSTLGQPDWMAAYLGILLPILTALFLNFIKDKEIKIKNNLLSKNFLVTLGFAVFYIAMYAAFMYTNSRTAILALWLSLFILFAFYAWFYIKPKLNNKSKPIGLKILTLLIVSSFIVTFFTGLPGGFPFNRISKFTFNNLVSSLNKPQAVKQAVKPVASPTPAPIVNTGELGGTDSTKIRSYVWQGAIEIWKHNPLIGTGVETYAFAYYMYRPAGHNMTSEWQYLYNKAHNEFLNYLATTGTIGILTYLSIILGFYYITGKYLYQRLNKLGTNELLIFSCLAGYTVINITNFGGFSVVIVNILFYLIPLFALSLAGLIKLDKSLSFNFAKDKTYVFGSLQKAFTIVVVIISAYLIYTLINYWNADRYYYFGYNYDRTGDYQKAYTYLRMATNLRPGEPVFQDELAYNNTIIGASIISQSQNQKDANQQQNLQIAKQLISNGVALENKVTTEHPNNVVFWKTKVRIFYTLAQLDQSYFPQALEAIKRAAVLAPTDADISYNLGVLYGQNGDFNNAIANLENTNKLKPDYKNGQAYYALAVFYHQLSLDAKGKVINKAYNQKAIDELNFKIKNFGQDPQASEAIKLWSQE